MTEWRPLAEQGDSGAQFNLGVMYAEGEGGVPQDYEEAVRWYQLAADGGLRRPRLTWDSYTAKARGWPRTIRQWKSLFNVCYPMYLSWCTTVNIDKPFSLETFLSY